jgi:Cupin domain
VPGDGGTRLLIVQYPPDCVFDSPSFDPAAAAAENLRIVPGIAETFEIDAPGMHRTPSVDYGIMLEGELVLELDDGVTRSLRPGDVVIQNGTRHAWRNPTDAPATIAFVLVGANRT